MAEDFHRNIPNVRRGLGGEPFHEFYSTLPRACASKQSKLGCLGPAFDDLSQDQLDAHLRVGRYGNFSLTDAVRPSIGLDVIPREGYRRDVYCDPETGNKMPVLAASVSAERLFDVFMDLLDPLGEEVDVVMESSHESEPGSHADLYREHMDTVILKSTLYDYEPLLLTTAAPAWPRLNPNGPMEVQFDEHKLLFVYAHDLEPFEEILLQYGLKRDDTLKFISEAEHLHSTDDVYRDQFEELLYRLGNRSVTGTPRPVDCLVFRFNTQGEAAARGCLALCSLMAASLPGPAPVPASACGFDRPRHGPLP